MCAALWQATNEAKTSVVRRSERCVVAPECLLVFIE